MQIQNNIETNVNDIHFDRTLKATDTFVSSTVDNELTFKGCSVLEETNFIW